MKRLVLYLCVNMASFAEFRGNVSGIVMSHYYCLTLKTYVNGCSQIDHIGPNFDILFNSALSLSPFHWIFNKKKIDNNLNRKKQSKTIIVIICMSRGYCTTRIIFASKLLVERKNQLNIAYWRPIIIYTYETWSSIKKKN